MTAAGSLTIALAPPRRSAALWLFRKEWRELMASRAWWVTCVLTGPIVGLSFIASVRLYGELSGVGGTAGGVGEAFSPLVGVIGPTFGAYEIVALFMLPFVAIRLVGAERHTGSLVLERQQMSLSPAALMAVKAAVLLAGWLLLSLAAVIAVGLWLGYGGHVHWPELVSVAMGHLLNAGLAIALGAVAASLAEHPSTAAVIALGFTVGTWVVSFLGAINGGFWGALAVYTPSTMLSFFQHGFVRLDVVLAALALGATGWLTAAIWSRAGATRGQRIADTAAIVVGAAAIIGFATVVRLDWDTTENHQNSFSQSETAALRSIVSPLTIEARLAPEDGRRAELERVALSKLRRVMPRLTVRYVSATTAGMFEQTAEGYGEIRYTLAGRTATSRMVTREGVLETIFELARIEPGAESDTPYPGYPLAARPTGAAALFYIAWPVLTGGLGVVALRRHR